VLSSDDVLKVYFPPDVESGSNVIPSRARPGLQGYLAYKKAPPPLGPYRRPMPRVLGGSQGGGRFLMSEVPL